MHHTVHYASLMLNNVKISQTQIQIILDLNVSFNVSVFLDLKAHQLIEIQENSSTDNLLGNPVTHRRRQI